MALLSRRAFIEWSSLVFMVLSSIVSYRKVPYISNTLAESQIGSLFSYFGLQRKGLRFGIEKGDMSIGSLLSILVSTSSTVNLFTSSWSTLVTGHSLQNPCLF